MGASAGACGGELNSHTELLAVKESYRIFMRKAKSFSPFAVLSRSVAGARFLFTRAEGVAQGAVGLSASPAIWPRNGGGGSSSLISQSSPRFCSSSANARAFRLLL